MRLIIILALTTFLTSCKDAIICAQIDSAKIKPLIIKDLSFQFERCRIQCFNINEWKTYPHLNNCEEFKDNPETEEIEYNEPSKDMELKYCDGLVGFDFRDMAQKIRPKIKELNDIKKDNCK